MALPLPRPVHAVNALVALVTVTALPLAIVTIPNTISVVAHLLPPGFSGVELSRAHGLALPALLLTVPIAAVAARRFRAWAVLIVGLLLLALADAAGGWAASVPVVGVLRVLHGVGGGLLIPATLVAVWERPAPIRRWLVAVWCAALTAALLVAQPLALLAVRQVTDWRVTLQPYPLLTGCALVVAAAYVLVRRRAGGVDLPIFRHTERTHLLMAAVPAFGVALLAIGTTFGWPATVQIVAAALLVVALLGLAGAGILEGAKGRAVAFAMVCVGLVVLPTAGFATTLAAEGLGGPGLLALWVPLSVAAVGAVAGALAAGGERGSGRLSAVGLVAVVGGLCVLRFVTVPLSLSLLIASFAMMAAGAAIALTAGIRTVDAGAALFALALCFPAVLTGYVLGLGIMLSETRSALDRSGGSYQDAIVGGFVSGLHLWALAAGFAVVVALVLGTLLTRARPDSVRVPAEPVPAVTLVPRPAQTSPDEADATPVEVSETSDR